jgi:hypothetical protein
MGRSTAPGPRRDDDEAGGGRRLSAAWSCEHAPRHARAGDRAAGGLPDRRRRGLDLCSCRGASCQGATCRGATCREATCRGGHVPRGPRAEGPHAERPHAEGPHAEGKEPAGRPWVWRMCPEVVQTLSSSACNRGRRGARSLRSGQPRTSSRGPPRIATFSTGHNRSDIGDGFTQDRTAQEDRTASPCQATPEVCIRAA